MARNSFPIFYDDWDVVIERFSNEHLGLLIRALIRHAKEQPRGELPENVELAYSLMAGAIDRYSKRCIANSENGRKGGAPHGNSNAKKTSETTENKPIQAKTTENKPIQAKTTENKPHTTSTSISNSISNNVECSVCGFDPAKQDANLHSDHASKSRSIASQVHKLYSEDNEYIFTEDESIEILDHYLSAYKSKTGKSHPRITNAQMCSILKRLPDCYDNRGDKIDLSSEHYAPLIDAYFESNLDCSYRITHFMSGEIRANRYYETLYRGTDDLEG